MKSTIWRGRIWHSGYFTALVWQVKSSSLITSCSHALEFKSNPCRHKWKRVFEALLKNSVCVCVFLHMLQSKNKIWISPAKWGHLWEVRTFSTPHLQRCVWGVQTLFRGLGSRHKVLKVKFLIQKLEGWKVVIWKVAGDDHNVSDF